MLTQRKARAERIAQAVGVYVGTPARQRRVLSVFVVVMVWHAGLWLVAATLAVYLFGHRSHIRTGRRMLKRYKGARGEKGKVTVSSPWGFVWTVCVRGYRPTRAACIAVRPEIAVTKLTRRQKWWEHLCEVRHITPVPKVTGYERTDDGTKTTLRLNGAGLTVEQLRRYIPGIKLYIGRGVIDVRIAEHPTDPETAFMYVITRDLLKEPLGPWPLLHEPIGSRSIADGVLIGRNTSNRDILVDVTRDVMFVGGQRGMGKSTELHQIVAGVSLCHDAAIILWDMREGAEFFMYQGRVLEFVDTPDGALASAHRLNALRKERGAYLRAKRLKKWEPGCGLPFIFLVVDEVAECDDGKGPGPTQQLLTQIVRLGRGAGIGGVLATQRPDAKYIDTALRAQCGVGVSFKVRPGDEQITLGPGAKKLGLDPATLPPHQFIGLGGPFPDGGKGRGWWLSDPEVEQFVARLPLIEPTVPIEIAKVGTVWHGNEGYMEPDLPESPLMPTPLPQVPARAPEPPPECDGNEKTAKLWAAIPGEPWELIGASGYSRERVRQIMNTWDARGLVVKVGNQWRHREPDPDETGDSNVILFRSRES